MSFIRKCDLCGRQHLGSSEPTSWAFLGGKLEGGAEMFPEGRQEYGGRYLDLCGFCTEKISCMFKDPSTDGRIKNEAQHEAKV